MTLIRPIVLLAGLGFVVTSSFSLLEESEPDWICCDHNGDCENAGGKCCDYSSQGVEDCSRDAIGYCREACLAMGGEE